MSVPARLLELERERSSMPPVRALADQVFSRAAGAPLIGGNEVRLLKDAAENYPAWLDAITATVTPPHLAAFKQHSYLYLVIGLVGTTIAPWMQFYLRASVVEKGVTRRQYKASQLDVVVGCIFTDVVAWFIIVACAATLYVHGHRDVEVRRPPRTR